MARTEAQLRRYYGTHPDGGMRCTDEECVQCETRNLLAEIDRLRGSLREIGAALTGPTTMQTTTTRITVRRRGR